jgi:C4-type Zn-finger protein
VICLNKGHKHLRDNKKGVTWRSPVICPECNKQANLTSLNIPYANVSNWAKQDFFCPHCGYPHREMEVLNENPDKPTI